MANLIKIRLKNSGRVIEVIPPVARARVGGGTAEYVDTYVGTDLASKPDSSIEHDITGGQPETAALVGAPETATGKAQNPPAKQGRGKK